MAKKFQILRDELHKKKKTRFLEDLRKSAEQVRNSPEWMKAGIDLNPKQFETYKYKKDKEMIKEEEAYVQAGGPGLTLEETIDNYPAAKLAYQFTKHLEDLHIKDGLGLLYPDKFEEFGNEEQVMSLMNLLAMQGSLDKRVEFEYYDEEACGDPICPECYEVCRPKEWNGPYDDPMAQNLLENDSYNSTIYFIISDKWRSDLKKQTPTLELDQFNSACRRTKLQVLDAVINIIKNKTSEWSEEPDDIFTRVYDHLQEANDRIFDSSLGKF